MPEPSVPTHSRTRLMTKKPGHFTRYNLFLDDQREVTDVFPENRESEADIPDESVDWIVCRSAAEFGRTLHEHGLPEFVSYDFYLSTTDPIAPTGAHCARRMMRVAYLEGVKHPPYHVHSSSEDGAANIHAIISQNTD